MQKYSTPAIVPGGGKDALSIETLPDVLFGSVDVYLASDVDARIAELEKAHERYEKLRRLDPRQFHSLWMQNIALGEKFDDLVDRLPD